MQRKPMVVSARLARVRRVLCYTIINKNNNLNILHPILLRHASYG